MIKRNIFPLKNPENINKTKEIGETPKSLGRFWENVTKFKNSSTSFVPKGNTNIFKGFYENMSDNFVNKLTTAWKVEMCWKNETKSYYDKVFNKNLTFTFACKIP